MIKNEDEKAGNEAAEVRRTQLIKPAHMVVMEGVVVLHHCFTTVLRANSPRRRFDDNSVGRMDRISKIDLTTPLSLSLSLSLFSLFSLSLFSLLSANKPDTQCKEDPPDGPPTPIYFPSWLSFIALRGILDISGFGLWPLTFSLFCVSAAFIYFYFFLSQAVSPFLRNTKPTRCLVY